jgi:hypothetical protein
MNKLTLPVYFRVPQSLKGEIGSWLRENKILTTVSYYWISGILGFENEEDAVAFSLKFGIYRAETTIDKMLKNEESYN